MTNHRTAYRWQSEAHAILGDLIREGRDAGLPPLTWTVAVTGAIVGEVPSLTADEHAAQRATMTAWARLLGATVTERATDDVTHLHAFIDYAGERRGALRAEIRHALNDDASDGNA